MFIEGLKGTVEFLVYELKIFKKIPFSSTFFSIFDSLFEKKKFNTPLEKNHFDCNQFYITRPVTSFNIYIYIIIFERDASKLDNEHEERLIDEYSQKSITSRVRPLLETFEKSRRDTDRERAEAALPAIRQMKRSPISIPRRVNERIEVTSRPSVPISPLYYSRRRDEKESRNSEGGRVVIRGIFLRPIENRSTGDAIRRGSISFLAKGSLRGINRETKACRRNGRLSSLSNCKRSRDEIAGGWLFIEVCLEARSFRWDNWKRLR